MIIKICGMNNLDNLNAIAAYKPDYFGFIFYKNSPRHVSLKNIPEFEYTDKVGVFVDEDEAIVIKKQKEFNLNAIQLHGNESLKKIETLRKKLSLNVKLFKAISVSGISDLQNLKRYEHLVDVILLDTKTNVKGGSGKKFDWALLQYYNCNIPFILSGGIRPEDGETVVELNKNFDKMLGVDINSKFELKPGLKHTENVKTFIQTLKSQ